MKKTEDLIRQYKIKSMREVDSASFSASVMQSIGETFPTKVYLEKRLFARFSMISSTVAAAVVVALLVVSQLNNRISPEKLELNELIAVLSGIGEESILYSATDSESLYDDIMLAEELEQKL